MEINTSYNLKNKREGGLTKQVLVGTGCPSNFLRSGAHAYRYKNDKKLKMMIVPIDAAR